LGVVTYSPLGRGVLTGKYDPGAAPPAESRAGRQDKRMMEMEFHDRCLQVAQSIKHHAQAKGISATQFAVAWVLNNELVTSVIVGPRTQQQWEEYLAALAYQFSGDDEQLVDKLVVTGHLAMPHFNDPAYPIEGRVVRSGAKNIP
jgi:aryl-alcohol dehydrogenase-like predicted oxidoreductase